MPVIVCLLLHCTSIIIIIIIHDSIIFCYNMAPSCCFPCNGPNTRCLRYVCLKSGRRCVSCRLCASDQCRNSKVVSSLSTSHPPVTPTITRLGSPAGITTLVDGSGCGIQQSSTRFSPSVGFSTASVDKNLADSSMPATYDVAVAPGGVPSSSPTSGLPSLSSVVWASVPTLQHVPKGGLGTPGSWWCLAFRLLFNRTHLTCTLGRLC